ncbi:MAG: ABC transporter permease [Thermomicrobiales bacterium]|nr:ABC transporter permease [Thermomicrobiales bacterium]
MSELLQSERAPDRMGVRPAGRASKPAGAYTRAWRRFKRNPSAMAGLVVLIAIVLFVLLAGVISTYITGFDYSENHLESVLSRPGENGYILGSDGNGRDILTRLAYGGRVSMLVAVLATVTTLLLGGTIGLIAGYAGGFVDSALMRLADVFLSIPALSILILIAALYRPDQYRLSLVIAFVLWPGVSRLLRGEALALRRRDYIEAARAVGAGDARIIGRHLLPNVLPTIIVWSSLVIPAFILTEAALSFLGLGVRSPTPSWGNMLSEAQPFYRSNWTNVFFPGLAIFLTALSVNLVGNGLRDALDPRLEK